MKKLLFLIVLFVGINLQAQTSPQKATLYHPEDNAQQKIEEAVSLAQKEHKFVVLQVGGNWCIWCLRFNDFVQNNPTVKKLFNDNFVVYHLNYSKENKNEKTLATLGYPQRFGFPVFVILNEKGERIHTQQSDFLEDGKEGYDEKTVVQVFKNWTPAALNPENYKK